MDAQTIAGTFWGMITPEMAAVAAAVYGVCFALKRARFFPDRLIPLTALALGIIFEVPAAAVLSRTALADCVLRGILCGMAAVFAANIIKQAKGGKESDTDQAE